MEGWQEEGVTITVACNGKLALNRLKLKPINPTEAHYDILAAIQVFCCQTPITSKFNT